MRTAILRGIGCSFDCPDMRRDFPRLMTLWRKGALDLEGMFRRRIELTVLDDAFQAMSEGGVIRSVVTF